MKTGKLVLRCAATLGLLWFGLTTGSPASAQLGNTTGEAVLAEDGYLMHDDGTMSATYPGDGSSTYRYNPTGEDIVVTRDGVGLYTVAVSAAEQSFTPTVTAMTASANHCKVGSYLYPGTEVAIRCYDSDGVLVDEEFTLRWTTTVEDAAFLVAGDGSGFCCGTNPWGATPNITRSDVGVYVVSTPGGPNFEAGHVQITAVGEDDVHCKIAFWGSLNSTVMCFDSLGEPADSSFTFLRVGSSDDAHVWAHDATATTSYTPLRQYSNNPLGPDPTAISTGTGAYTVSIPSHLVDFGGSVSVTAWGTTSIKCSVVDWPDDETVNVSCTDELGAASNSEFNMLFTRFRTCNGVPANIELSNGGAPTAGDDVILGTPAADDISALDGNDTVCGGDGDDTIVGGAGDDTILGQAGNDLLSGNSGNDTVYGGADDDTVYAGSGDDTVNGGDGNDVLGGSSGVDVVLGQDGADTITGGSDADAMVSGGEGDDAVNGGGGDDTMVTGDIGDDTVSGNGGDDTITGGDGADEVRGGPGDDTVLGGEGDDFVAGNAGVDICDGEAGTDTAASNCETILNVP
jgi:Ca2+-binding RTX toxin-like protein